MLARLCSFRAIHDSRPDHVLDVLALTRRQFVVKDDERRLLLRHQQLEFLDLPLAEVRAGMWTIELLREPADDLGARRVSQPLELLQVFVE